MFKKFNEMKESTNMEREFESLEKQRNAFMDTHNRRMKEMESMWDNINMDLDMNFESSIPKEDEKDKETMSKINSISDELDRLLESL